MKLEKEKVCSQKYYSVGCSSALNKFVLSIVVTQAVWYEKYYEISENEYNMFGTDELYSLVKQLNNEGNQSDRFLFSDKNEKNNAEQLLLRDTFYRR